MSLTASRELIDSRKLKWKQARNCKIKRYNPGMAPQNRHAKCTLYSISNEVKKSSTQYQEFWR